MENIFLRYEIGEGARTICEETRQRLEVENKRLILTSENFTVFPLHPPRKKY